MALFNEACQNFVRFDGGQLAPIGSFWCERTMEVFQQASDGTLPLDGVFFQITTSGSTSLANCAVAINAAMGTSYTSSNLHTHISGDVIAYPGQSAQDA